MLDLFKEIYVKFKIPADFPDVTRHPGFDFDFEEDGSPRPRYLGRLTDQMGLLELEEMIPQPGTEPGGPQVLDDRTFSAFRRKMEAAILAGKNRQKNAKSKKKQDRVVQKRGWCAQLKRKALFRLVPLSTPVYFIILPEHCLLLKCLSQALSQTLSQTLSNTQIFFRTHCPC